MIINMSVIHINKINDYKRLCNDLNKKWYKRRSGNSLCEYIFLENIEDEWITLFLEENKRVSMIYWIPRLRKCIQAKNFLSVYDL